MDVFHRTIVSPTGPSHAPLFRGGETLFYARPPECMHFVRAAAGAVSLYRRKRYSRSAIYKRCRRWALFYCYVLYAMIFHTQKDKINKDCGKLRKNITELQPFQLQATSFSWSLYSPLSCSIHGREQRKGHGGAEPTRRRRLVSARRNDPRIPGTIPASWMAATH